jgi:tryptophan-rich sensory protein
MGISSGLIWNQMATKLPLVKKGMLFFVIQLALNALWSYIFFGLHNFLLAFVEIILLWLMIYETYHVFKQIDKKAAYLLVPYLVWVGFATLLTGSIFWLNR